MAQLYYQGRDGKFYPDKFGNGGRNNVGNHPYVQSPNYQNQPRKKRSGAGLIHSKTDRSEVLGYWGWCLRDKQIVFIQVWYKKKNNCERDGSHSAYAVVLNRVTGHKVITGAIIREQKQKAYIPDMGIVLSPNKNFCGNCIKSLIKNR